MSTVSHEKGRQWESARPLFANGCNIHFLINNAKKVKLYVITMFKDLLFHTKWLSFFFYSDWRLGWLPRLVRMSWLMARGRRHQLGIRLQCKLWGSRSPDMQIWLKQKLTSCILENELRWSMTKKVKTLNIHPNAVAIWLMVAGDLWEGFKFQPSFSEGKPTK